MRVAPDERRRADGRPIVDGRTVDGRTVDGRRAVEGRTFDDRPPVDARSWSRGRLVVGAVATPLGEMVAAVTDAGVAFLEFADTTRPERQRRRLERARGLTAVPGDHAVLTALRSGLEDWFTGRCQTIDVPLDAVGTAFEHRCWEFLGTIPCGETRSYAAAARALGTAPRAVARSNATNPLAILVPCHRLVGSDGSLTGYGGGLERKRALLDLERRLAG